MRLRITHETRYEYSPPVEHALHMAHLKPPSTRYQTLLAHGLNISPTPTVLDEKIDVYGNARSFFEICETHEALIVRASRLGGDPTSR